MANSEMPKDKERDKAPHMPAGMVGKDMPNVSKRMEFSGEVPVAADIVDIASLGGGIRLISECKRELTHEQAYKILELAEFVVAGRLVDRNLVNTHVEDLIKKMKQGVFFPEWVCIMSCVCLEANGDKPAGTEYRINGQHVCWARLAMALGWPCLVKFMRYEAKTIADMRLLYANADGGRVRTPANKINSYMAGVENFEDASPRILRVLAAGVKLWLSPKNTKLGKGRHASSADEIAFQLLRERKELALRVKSFLVGLTHCDVKKQTAFRAPIVAAMFETFNVLAGAGEFWTVVCTGLGADGALDPRYKLHNTLRESTIGDAEKITKDRQSGKKVVNAEGMLAQCINCWNAWRRGETLQNVKATVGGKRPRAV